MNRGELERRFFSAPSREALDRMYRILSKHTHPDTSGGDGGDFLVVRETYEAARRRWDSPEGAARPMSVEADAAPVEPADPWALIRDEGYGSSLDPRAALVVSLHRLHVSGLGNPRLRTQQGNSRRAREIIATVLHWARRVDPLIQTALEDFLVSNQGELQARAYLKAARDARQFIEDGFPHFYRFHQEGRSGSRTMAQRAFDNALDTARVYGLEESATGRYAAWLLEEGLREPLLTGVQER